MKIPLSKSSIFLVGYVILISSWFVAWLFLGDEIWWLALINRVVPYLFLPVPLIFVKVIPDRNFKAVIPLLLPAIIFGSLYYPFLLPKIARTDEMNPEFRVMTYNVLYSNRDYDAVANVIMTYRPDLVALQEVQPEMMGALRERLRTDYPYSILGTENKYGTTAIFSQHPFADSYVLNLQADRPAVVVKTNVQDRTITFVAVHLLAYGLWWVKPKVLPVAVMKRTADQNQQVEMLLKEIEKEDGIVIVGCDCNSLETSSSYRILDRSLDNAARKTGWSLQKIELPGVSQDTALQHIDFVWYRGSVEPLRVYRVHNNGGSDHLPVLTLFSAE